MDEPNFDDKLKLLIELTDHCLVPELKNDFDLQLIDAKNFSEFHDSLKINLIQLFDLIQQNEFLLNENDKKIIEFQYKFVLLLCEQTASKSIYHIKDTYLQNNFETLIEKHFETLLSHKEVEEAIQEYYKQKLNVALWKKFIGATSGFLQYLKFRYSNGNCIDPNFSTFCLSVGLLLKDFYDPYYKEIGITILNFLLVNTSKCHLLELNIPSIIFDEVLTEVSKLSTNSGILITWTCLYESLILQHPKSFNNFSNWSKIDDFLITLIQQIVFAKKSYTWLILYKFISKVSVYYSCEAHVDPVDFNDALRLQCTKIEPLVMYRWCKDLMDFLVAESNYLMGDHEVTLKVLKEMHIMYLFCIFPIKTEISEPHLTIFLTKFSMILVQAYKNNINNLDVKQSVKQFLQTLLYQLDKSKSSSESEILQSIRKLINCKYFC